MGLHEEGKESISLTPKAAWHSCNPSSSHPGRNLFVPFSLSQLLYHQLRTFGIMVDPGTALAIVSLSITICEGVISYCSGLDHKKEDVRALEAASSELQEILQNVENWLQSHPILSDSLVHTVDQCTKSCLANIDGILRMCTYYSPPTIPNIKSRLLHVKRGLQFPLKKGTVQSLKDQMESLRSNVTLALILLSTYVAVWNRMRHY